MNSEIIPKNYATSDDIVFGAHFVTLVSNKVTYENPSGKFAISYATTSMSSGSEYNKTYPKISTGNVINKDNLGTSKITNTNYLTLTVPKHYFYITKIDIETNITPCHHGAVGTCNPKNIIYRKEYYKGQRFLVVNAGGNIDSPCIVGVE